MNQEKEAIQNDCRFAAKTLAAIARDVPEAEMCCTNVLVNAEGLRSCLELFASMLEDDGVDVVAEEDFQHVLGGIVEGCVSNSTVH